MASFLIISWPSLNAIRVGTTFMLYLSQNELSSSVISAFANTYSVFLVCHSKMYENFKQNGQYEAKNTVIINFPFSERFSTKLIDIELNTRPGF